MSMYCTQFGCNIEGPHEHKIANKTTDYGRGKPAPERDKAVETVEASAAGSIHEQYAHVGDREQDVGGYFCGARHIGGTTWRFGSGDLCADPQYGSATLADHGQLDEGAHLARFIVAAIDNAIKESRAANLNTPKGDTDA